MAFAQLASVSCLQLFGQQAPETLGYQGIVADPAAQLDVSLQDFQLPATVDLPQSP